VLSVLLALGLFAGPAKINCQVTQPAERPGVWDVRTNFDDECDDKGQLVFHQVQKPRTFEHQSRKSALNECNKILSDAEKRWKQERKKR
jgi:hypothetical protein